MAKVVKCIGGALTVAVCLVGTLGVGGPAWGVPAAPIEVTLTQPDGTSFLARAWGDEFYNGMETLDGYSIVEESGAWYYASRTPDGRLEASADRVGTLSTSQKALLPRRLRPAVDPSVIRQYALRPLGSGPGAKSLTHAQFVLTILVDYDDISFTYSDASFESLMYGGSNSVGDFYLENSYGSFTITPAAEDYPSASDNDGIVHIARGINHPNPTGSKLYTEASAIVSAVDTLVDFSVFDTNADFDVSASELSIVIILAGYETSYTSTAPTVWGHKWSFPAVELDSVWLSPYTMFGEKHGTHQATIGIMCHELGHLMLGLPDLYDTNGGSEGIGNWGLMGGGSWNVAAGYIGTSPAHLSAPLKAAVDMTTPTDMDTAQTTVSIQQGDLNADIKRLWVDPYKTTTGEYFLVENRQRSGYDAGLPAAGLMIWHVDGGQFSNQDEDHKTVDVEAADGLTEMDSQANQGDGGDPFPGTSTNTTFNDGSTPNSKDYNNASTGVAVTSISASGATMTADFTPRAIVFGDNVRYDTWASGAGWGYGSPTAWSALEVYNSTSMDTLDGFDVFILDSTATVDFQLYTSIPGGTPTTLIASETGFAATFGWNRFLLSAPKVTGRVGTPPKTSRAGSSPTATSTSKPTARPTSASSSDTRVSFNSVSREKGVKY